MLEKIFGLADKCDKRDTTIRKIPDIYQDGTIRYVFDITDPWTEESEKAQSTLLDFLAENCFHYEDGFMYGLYSFDDFEIEIDIYD